MSLIRRSKALAVVAVTALASSFLVAPSHAAPPKHTTLPLAVADDALAPEGTILAERSDAGQGPFCVWKRPVHPPPPAEAA